MPANNGLQPTSTARSRLSGHVSLSRTSMDIPPDDRQLKLLRLFGVSTTGMSGRAAREAIRAIWTEPANQERWSRYVYLTGDLGSETPDLKPFEPDALEHVVPSPPPSG